jgi:arylsulfatase
MIASWPDRIPGGGAVRRQFMHVTDLMPTVLALAGVPPLRSRHGVAARRMDGLDCAAVLTDDAPSPRREQYYECWSKRAYVRSGWVARSLQVRGQPIDMDNWTLHNLAEDFSESTDVAAHAPDKLAELVAAFDDAAWSNDVYPLDNRGLMGKLSDASSWHRALADEPRRYRPGAPSVHRNDVMPAISNRSFRVRVALRQRAGDEGVLWALGDFIGGMVMYVEHGRLRFHYNGFGDVVEAPHVELPPGTHHVLLDYEALGDRRGRGRIVVAGGGVVDWTDFSPTLMFGPFEGLDVGLDRRAPVSWHVRDRHGTFPYTGTIEDVWIEPGPRAPR